MDKPELEFRFAVLTDTGRQRELNEDRVGAWRPDDPTVMATHGDLLVVADGMGGHLAGEVASTLALETVYQTYYHSGSNDPAELLREAIETANETIYSRSQRDDRLGMGTTVVAAAHRGNTLYYAHVGDSRLYLIRNGEIQQLTRDHSLVASHVEAGILTPEQAAHHPQRNVILRAVGTGAHVEVDVQAPMLLQDGDVLVLCSDGLTEHVPKEMLGKLATTGSPEQAVQALVQAANNKGGSDNISVIVAWVGAGPREIAPGSEAITRPLGRAEVEEEVAQAHAVLTAPAAPPTPRASGGSRRGSPLVWLLALGGGLLIGALGFWALMPGDDTGNSTPTPAPPTTTSPAGPTPTTITGSATVVPPTGVATTVPPATGTVAPAATPGS
jgi:serine/threonine protein phosphatase PrpC